MAATSSETFKSVAERGLPLFVGLRGDGLEDLAANIRHYREIWKDRGHPGSGSVYLRVPFYAAKTEIAALEEPRKNIIYYFERQARLITTSDPKGGPNNATRLIPFQLCPMKKFCVTGLLSDLHPVWLTG